MQDFIEAPPLDGEQNAARPPAPGAAPAEPGAAPAEPAQPAAARGADARTSELASQMDGLRARARVIEPSSADQARARAMLDGLATTMKRVEMTARRRLGETPAPDPEPQPAPTSPPTNTSPSAGPQPSTPAGPDAPAPGPAEVAVPVAAGMVAVPYPWPGMPAAPWPGQPAAAPVDEVPDPQDTAAPSLEEGASFRLRNPYTGELVDPEPPASADDRAALAQIGEDPGPQPQPDAPPAEPEAPRKVVVRPRPRPPVPSAPTKVEFAEFYGITDPAADGDEPPRGPFGLRRRRR